MVTDAKNATALNDRGKFPQTDMQAHGPKAPTITTLSPPGS
jgi:hypothetical protein